MKLYVDDFGHTFTLRVLDRDKRPQDLSTVTLVEYVWHRPDAAGGHTVVVTAAALLTDGTDAKVTGLSPAGLFDVGGNWKLFAFLRTLTHDIHAGPLELFIEPSPRT